MTFLYKKLRGANHGVPSIPFRALIFDSLFYRECSWWFVICDLLCVRQPGLSADDTVTLSWSQGQGEAQPHGLEEVHHGQTPPCAFVVGDL